MNKQRPCEKVPWKAGHWINEDDTTYTLDALHQFEFDTEESAVVIVDRFLHNMVGKGDANN